MPLTLILLHFEANRLWLIFKLLVPGQLASGRLTPASARLKPGFKQKCPATKLPWIS
jgi:hypothetical protein